MIFSRSGNLPFPILQFLQDQGEDKTIRRYSLNWGPVEHSAENSFKRFLVNNKQEQDVGTFLPTLPEPYDTNIKNIVFAIPAQVEREIRYFSRTAKEVWEEERSLTPELNDMSLEVALTSANVALNILCSFMENATDKADLLVNAHGVMYKFWNGQVNSQMVKRQAGFAALQERINNDGVPTEDKKKFLEFSEAINLYEKARQDLFKTFVKPEENAGSPEGPLPNPSATQGMTDEGGEG
jgi:hypothetical protein